MVGACGPLPLTPFPANFTDAGTIAQLQETFVFWRVAKGGIGLPGEAFPWASVMPPWEQHLTVDEIWKVDHVRILAYGLLPADLGLREDRANELFK